MKVKRIGDDISSWDPDKRRLVLEGKGRYSKNENIF